MTNSLRPCCTYTHSYDYTSWQASKQARTTPHTLPALPTHLPNLPAYTTTMLSKPRAFDTIL